MNGITYNRLKSPYEGDKTKDCALSVNEMDNNFFVLEGRDVKSVDVVGDELVINLFNGGKISNKDAFGSFVRNLEFDFDSEKGILTIKHDNEEYQICGFVTANDIPQPKDISSSTDETIIGNGSARAPMGIAPTYKTGQFRPVKSIVEGCGCGCSHDVTHLPKGAKVGDRYITAEKVNDYGFLYPFEGVKKMLCDLQDAGYEWSLPTKGDWDNMLNAIEPKKEWKNHNEVTTHKSLGKKAGKFLKSKDGWKLEDTNCDCDCDCHDSIDYDCDYDCHCHDDYHCHDHHHHCHEEPICGELGHCKEKELYPNAGIDKFGFAALPAGFADARKNYYNYATNAYFWTKTNSGYGAYIKRLDYDSSKVYQDTLDMECYASVRLVKKYNGYNFRGAEEIFGETYPVVMIPSEDGGYTLWTSINIQLNNRCYKAMQIPVDDIECTTRYYINEWNGRLWVKNLLHEGDSVVVMDAPDGKVDDEYRITGGVLSRVNDMVFNDLMDDFDEKLSDIKEDVANINLKVTQLEVRVDTLEDSLETETTERKAEDVRIEAKLDTEIAERKAEDEAINARVDEIDAKLEAEIAERKAEDEAINARVDEIDTKLEAEIAERKAEDVRIEAKLDAEIERATAREDEIEVQIPNNGVYDAENGVLTVNRDAEKKFDVQFSYNFGEF